MRVLGFVVCFLILFLGWAGFWGYGFYFDNVALEKEVLFHLEGVAEEKASRVEDFLNERKVELEYLEEGREVEQIFSGNFLLRL